MLAAAAIILLITAIAHSYLGERYILIRLFSRNKLPELMGGDEFTKSTLRFAWHITSITWLGIAAVLYFDNYHSALFLYSIAAISLFSAAMAAFFTKGKHLSWVAFLSVSVLSYLSVA
ncbi:hypothetical protein [uncultured Paraglaciecola sp.]|uniref:hypothetical protein n=1 Tax=uncultured Paraglaciecola sp. TaxID=1765024 RepID=UPI0030DA7E05|tara:strand:+ start:56196 stop:56549 length:354 start_codon:yes stop_codon:yes gene_type:complete